MAFSGSVFGRRQQDLLQRLPTQRASQFGELLPHRRAFKVYWQAIKKDQLQAISLEGLALCRAITAPVKHSKSDCLVLPARRT